MSENPFSPEAVIAAWEKSQRHNAELVNESRRFHYHTAVENWKLNALAAAGTGKPVPELPELRLVTINEQKLTTYFKRGAPQPPDYLSESVVKFDPSQLAVQPQPEPASPVGAADDSEPDTFLLAPNVRVEAGRTWTNPETKDVFVMRVRSTPFGSMARWKRVKVQE